MEVLILLGTPEAMLARRSAPGLFLFQQLDGRTYRLTGIRPGASLAQCLGEASNRKSNLGWGGHVPIHPIRGHDSWERI